MTPVRRYRRIPPLSDSSAKTKFVEGVVNPVRKLAYWLVAFSPLIFLLYMFRLWFMTFSGSMREMGPRHEPAGQNNTRMRPYS